MLSPAVSPEVAAGSVKSPDNLAPSVSGAEAAAPNAYWGPLPARTDSVSERFQPDPDRAWERIVDFPYDVLSCPVHLLNRGVKGVILFADEHDGYQRFVRPIVFQSIGPMEGKIGVSWDAVSEFGISFTGRDSTSLGEGNTLRIGLRAKLWSETTRRLSGFVSVRAPARGKSPPGTERNRTPATSGSDRRAVGVTSRISRWKRAGAVLATGNGWQVRSMWNAPRCSPVSAHSGRWMTVRGSVTCL